MDSERVAAHTGHADFSQSVEDDPLLDGPLVPQDCLEAGIKREFQKLPTAVVAALLAVVNVVYVSSSVALAALCWLSDTKSESCRAALGRVQPGTLVLLAKAGVWLLVFLFERCAHQHRGAARRRGYLHFYRSTGRIERAPLLLHSAGNAVVLVVVGAASMLDEKVKNLSVYLLLGIICLELLASILCLLVYSAQVVRFNNQRPSPDVDEEERSHAYSVSATHTETGFRDGSSLEDVVEKQADLIEYLRQHNRLLSKRILELGPQPIRD